MASVAGEAWACRLQGEMIQSNMIASKSNRLTQRSTDAKVPASTTIIRRPAKVRSAEEVFEGRFWSLAVLMCAASVAAVPVFSHQFGLSYITQLLALGTVGMAGLTIFWRIPRIHPALISYLLLVAYWGFSFTDDDRSAYLSMVKLAALAVAMQIIIRTPRHILWLLGIYSLAGIVSLILNWSDIKEIRYAMDIGAMDTESMRLGGTFANANAAGVFASIVSTCSLIVFFNTRHRARWFLLSAGLGSGLIIGGLSGSRTGMIGLFIAAMSVPFIAFAGERKQMLIKCIKGMLIAGVALGISLAALTQTRQFERLTRLTEGAEADGSTYARWGMAKEALGIWWDYPLFGAGFQGFARVSSQYAGRYSHTTYGEVLANGGLIGFALLGFFFILPGMQLALLALENRRPPIRKLSVGLLAFGMVFIFSCMFSILFASKDLIPLWAAICGFVEQQRTRRARTPAAVENRPAHAELKAGRGTGSRVPWLK